MYIHTLDIVTTSFNGLVFFSSIWICLDMHIYTHHMLLAHTTPHGPLRLHTSLCPSICVFVSALSLTPTPTPTPTPTLTLTLTLTPLSRPVASAAKVFTDHGLLSSWL